jgi:hypothetical protein
MVLQLQRARRMEGICEIEGNGLAFVECIYYLGKVLGPIVDTDGIEHWF